MDMLLVELIELQVMQVLFLNILVVMLEGSLSVKAMLINWLLE
jgi:hypothetical protein